MDVERSERDVWVRRLYFGLYVCLVKFYNLISNIM